MKADPGAVGGPGGPGGPGIGGCGGIHTLTLLVGMQTIIATMENSVEIP